MQLKAIPIIKDNKSENIVLNALAKKMPIEILSIKEEKNIYKRFNISSILIVPRNIDKLIKFFKALMDAFNEIGESVAKSYGISLLDLAKMYRVGLKRVSQERALLATKVTKNIRRLIGRTLIITEDLFNKDNVYVESNLAWKIVGLCFTDAKISSWLNNFSILFGTTSEFSAATYLHQLRIGILSSEYVRIAGNQPKMPLLFKTSINLINTIGNQALAKQFIDGINVSRRIYRMSISTLELLGYEPRREYPAESIEKIIKILSSRLYEEGLYPQRADEISAFIGSVLSYDGSVHGSSIVVNRKVTTLKGIILDSLVLAMRTANEGLLYIYKTSKYLYELPIIISYKILDLLINNVEYRPKRDALEKVKRFYYNETLYPKCMFR
jgi:hypothetical protein